VAGKDRPGNNLTERKAPADIAGAKKLTDPNVTIPLIPVIPAIVRPAEIAVARMDYSIITAGQYHNIRVSKEEELKVSVCGDATGEEGERIARIEPGFCLEGDDRVRRCHMRYRTDILLNISLSFDPVSMRCGNCRKGSHSVVRARGGGGVVFVACDQNFPALIPSKGEENCVSVVRVEDGSLKEISFILGDLLEGIELPEGSVVLIGSIAALHRDGLVAYAEDLARSIRILSENFGGRVTISPLVPIPLGGIANESLVKSIAEVDAWIARMPGPPGRVFRNTRRVLLELMTKNGIDRSVEGCPTAVRLPAAFEGNDKIRMYCVGWLGTPGMVGRFSADDEKKIVSSMLEELRSNFGVCVPREVEGPAEGSKAVTGTAYVVIGASHAKKIAEGLRRGGKQVVDLAIPGWRPSKENVEAVLKNLVGKVDENAVIILSMIDNAMFYEDTEDGRRDLPRKGADGRFHVEGSVVVAGDRTVKRWIYMCCPILEALEGNRKVILSPLPRYFAAPCCLKEGHCINFKDTGYRKEMLEDLRRARHVIEDTLKDQKVGSIKVVSTGSMIGLFDSRPDIDAALEVMGNDPVHLSLEGYRKIGDSVTGLIEEGSIKFSGGKRAREDEGDEESPRIGRRKEWIGSLVTGRGSGRGGRGGRGSWNRRGAYAGSSTGM
jgi:hypothetical protein